MEKEALVYMTYIYISRLRLCSSVGEGHNL